MSSPEEFYYSVARTPNVDASITPREKALELLRNESKGAPNWRYRNVSASPVTVSFGTSRFSHESQCFVQGPVVRVRWMPDEEVEIPASYSPGIHDVRISVGSTVPLCMGGGAPWQLRRVNPPQEYEVHKSLFPNPRAEQAAITRPKSWQAPKDGDL